MRIRFNARIGLVLKLTSACLIGSILQLHAVVGQESANPSVSTADPLKTYLSAPEVNEILLTQGSAMPGGGDVPFTDFNQPAPSQYNYSTGSAAPLFASPTFEQVQGGAGEEGPGAFRNTEYRWYGFVRLDGIYDFKPIAGTDSFITANIPVPQGEGDNATLTPRYTRLGFDTTTDLDFSNVDVNTRIEMDFFDGNNSRVFGSFRPRLRFAWIELGKLLVGQAASVFMDYDVFPNVLDYQGPPGMVLMRLPIARMKFPVFDDNTTVSTGIEQPWSDMQWDDGAGGFTVSPSEGVITDPTSDRSVQDVPDFTSNIRRDGDYGHVQLAGIARRLAFQEAGGPEFSETGYGANLTGTWHPFAWLTGCSPKATKCPQPWQKCRFLYQYAAGTGINRYFQDPNGFGLDAVFTPATGLQTIDSNGWFVAYEQWWAPRWASNFCYSEMNVDIPGVLPANTYEEGRYATANLIFLPFERFGVGVECLFGQRQNENGDSDQAYRIQTAVQYKF